MFQPYPETEALIEPVLDHFRDKTRPLRMLDLGTGSGCLLLAVLQEHPRASGLGIDCEPRAVAAAQENAALLGFDARARFILSDWGSELKETFDLVICNPPRVPSGIRPGMKAHIIGYHNNDMIALGASLDATDLGEADRLVEETRMLGGAIALMQRDPRSSSMATGASILPGYALYLTMAAFAGQIPVLEEAFNVTLHGSAAEAYGLQPGSSLSVPIRLERGRYEVVTRYPLTAAEKGHLSAARQRLTVDYDKLAADMSRPWRHTAAPPDALRHLGAS